MRASGKRRSPLGNGAIILSRSAVLCHDRRRTQEGTELLHETVSMEFAGVPLEEGLRKLLGRVDYAIEDVPREHDAAEIRVVVFGEQTVAAQTVAAKSGGRQARETASEKALRPGEQELQAPGVTPPPGESIA